MPRRRAGALHNSELRILSFSFACQLREEPRFTASHYLEHMGEHGYHPAATTLYRAVTRLIVNRFLAEEWDLLLKASPLGRPRKFYHITESGEAKLFSDIESRLAHEGVFCPDRELISPMSIEAIREAGRLSVQAVEAWVPAQMDLGNAGGNQALN